MSEKDELNALTQKVIAAAIAVHHELGPGMLESAYEACLMYELLSEVFTSSGRSRYPLCTAAGHSTAAIESTCSWKARWLSR